MGQIYERNIHSFLKMTNIVCKPTYNSDQLISVEVFVFSLIFFTTYPTAASFCKNMHSSVCTLSVSSTGFVGERHLSSLELMISIACFSVLFYSSIIISKRELFAPVFGKF